MLLLGANAQAQNYEEAKVPAYTLPAVLQKSDGTFVRNIATWEKERRPEILMLFEDNVYGQMPEAYDSIQYTLTNEAPDAMQGKAHLKEIEIAVWRNNKPVRIPLVLFIPNKARNPVPAFLFINNRDQSNTDPTRATKSDFWPAEKVVDSGYAIAAFHVSDAAPDSKETYQEGVLQLYPEQLKAENGMRAIGAWAWAASRAMDYLQQDKEIDAGKVAVVGHSRGGKAALWAGAQDQRFALVFSNCSGNTGAALSRRKFGETVKKINDTFPHWFTDSYKQYNDNEAALPVDQHMLVALIAPRPVYVTNASEDLWADPKGTYLSLVHAQKAYALYSKDPKLSPGPPAIDSPILHSYMGYHNRKGKHDLTSYDWQNFILFANYHYQNKDR
ncbi:acetylxylan esterase [Pontibacter saemangeumensis]